MKLIVGLGNPGEKYQNASFLFFISSKDDIINLMKQKVTNYTVIIEKEHRTGTKKPCYSAYVPLLGVATDADSLEKVQESIKKLVDFHIESLAQEGEPIPVEKTPSLITRFEARIPENAQIASN